MKLTYKIEVEVRGSGGMTVRMQKGRERCEEGGNRNWNWNRKRNWIDLTIYSL